MKHSFSAPITIIDGERMLMNPITQEGLKRWIKGKKKIHAVYTDKAPKRSLQQNSYFHGVYLPLIAEETGNVGKTEIEQLKNYLKQKLGYCTTRVFKSKGTETLVYTYKSTANMDKGEFTEFIMRVEELTGIPAPDTDEYLYGESSRLT